MSKLNKEESGLSIEVNDILGRLYPQLLSPHRYSPDSTQQGSWEMCVANYREPTAEDWAVFSGLTFDWSVNGRMETFKVVPENQPHVQKEL